MREKARPGLAGEGRAATRTTVLGGLPDSTRPGEFRNDQGRLCGQIVDNWLCKRLDTTRHQLRRPPAWCCDATHLERLKSIGAKGIRIIDEEGRLWQATLEDFERHGFPVRRGFGDQRGLTLDRWSVAPARKPRLPEVA